MRRRPLLFLGGCLLAALLAFGLGFAWFVHTALHPPPPPPHADGIVAFTGGAERVETALHLLADGRANQLLLSGIGGGAELGELAFRAGLNPAPLAARVKIGRNATTTRGNATETAAWAHARAIHSLIVVTAFYHMPRALAELRRALPGVTLYPVPVLLPPEADRLGGVMWRLLAEEYVKYLAAVTGVSAWLPEREPVAPHGHPA